MLTRQWKMVKVCARQPASDGGGAVERLAPRCLTSLAQKV